MVRIPNRNVATAAYATRDLGLFVLRVFAGVSLALAHGFGKLPPTEPFVGLVEAMGFPSPWLFAWAAGLSESVGGLLLAVGLFARPAALFILFTMLVASFVQQSGDPFLERELSLLYAAVAMHFLLTGPGRISLDAHFGTQRRQTSAIWGVFPRFSASRVKIDT